MTAAGRGGAVRLGVALPVFSSSPEVALRAAGEAERAGLDGIFVYDHLWPLGAPGHPAHSLFPLLGALAARTSVVALGPLVARVGLVANDELLTMLLAVERLSDGRLIAGLGTGDHKNAHENAAYGVALAPAGTRRVLLENAAARLLDAGVETWIGAGAPETNAIARRMGCPLNFWAATPERTAAAARLGIVTWAGDLPADDGEAAGLLADLGAAGASWIIVHWPRRAERLVEAAVTSGLRKP
ncbi:MAG: LLM class flavin-dependent oxidoreductase [Rhizomicrobium sp.]